MLKVYTASSWRNKYYDNVVSSIINSGHVVYDFRNPPSGTAFNWSDIDKDWINWTSKDFISNLKHPFSSKGFASDKGGIDWADVGVLVTPSGRSSHMEIGYMIGNNKPCIVLLNERIEPELTYKLATSIVTNIKELLIELDKIELNLIKKSVVKI